MDGAGRPLWRNVWVLAFTIVGTLTAIFSWQRIFWLYLRERGATDAQVAWGAFFLAVAYRVPQVLGGIIADRLSLKRVVVAGTFAMAAAYFGVAFAPGWRLPVAALCACWFVGALQWPSLVSLVAASVPEWQRGRAMGILEAGSMIGITVGPLVGERVLHWKGSLAEAVGFLLLASTAVYAACGLARLVLLREARRGDPGGAPAEGVAWRSIAVPAAATLLMFGLFFLTTDGPVMSLYIKDELGATENVVQWVGFAGGLGCIAGALVSGGLSDRLGAGRVMLLSACSTAALAFVLAAEVVPPSLQPLVFAALFVPGEAYIVAYQKLITSLGPSGRRGLAVGLVGTTVGLASSWAMVLGGTLYERGHRLPFVAAAALGGLVSLVALALCRRSFNPRT